MKLKKFSIRKIAMVATIAIAGLFGVSSFALNNNVKENPVVEEAKVEQAAARYDAIVAKYGMDGDVKYYDYINRNTNEGSILHSRGAYRGNSSFNILNLFSLDSDSTQSLIVIVASSVAILSVTSLSIILIKKKRKLQK